MSDWNLTAFIFFLSNGILFFLGSYGQAFFMWIHKLLINSNPEVFGVLSNVLSAFIMLLILWKLRVKGRT
ncbi:hypothetical protein D7Z54_01760 [Salibacterium salarium]|uniref:Uncharacterized protein n=1 Tax=Salibacterium salarium TaxID=284579 RepID=A0A428NA98_9BACI|nr:hypothetical protein [Salibacterium salarium]RSL35317.1 hypothetical protein D7Z54_01760 [Salibacterium salarium]